MENENLKSCKKCGKKVDTDDCNYVEANNDYYCCCNCAIEDGLAFCEGCEEWVFESDTTCCGGELLCDNCRDSSYFYCDNCDELTSNDECHEHDGNYYCNDCYDKLMCSDYIMDWHEYDDWQPHRVSNSDHSILFGFELEVVANKYDRYYIIEDIGAILQEHQLPDLFVYENDSSLPDNGFEIISHPMSYEFFKKNKNVFETILEYLREHGCTSHDAECCGLHIHLNRKDFIGNAENNLLALFVEHKNELIRFSRRSDLQYCHFWNVEEGDNALDFVKKFKKEGQTRYHAINFTNPDTIEVRLWRGTLNITTFFATIETTIKLLHLANRSSFELQKNLRSALEQAGDLSPDLKNYLEKRCL